ncbi:hypothetical protein [Nonomuraea soli]|uniref:ATP-binding protein n=1 Tax=Nonomuraea soli TaxID=1032476 RepID=A0A7W0CI62_9ACTN|nr:hypothetical protein [Nonomuraea soli]MBA2891395.1 hypothetical protein [Nonomuraea soli]
MAVACLGMAAALAGTAQAQSVADAGDPVSGLLGGGGSLLGGKGQNPIMSLTGPVTSLTGSKSPLDGLTRSTDGAAQSLDGAARLLPQGAFRNGVPLNDAAQAAGVMPWTKADGLTGAGSAPMRLALLDGREIVGLSHEADPMPGMLGAVTGRTEAVTTSPALAPVTGAAVPQVTDRLAAHTDQASYMARTATGQLAAVPTGDLLNGPTDALKSAVPDAVANELEPVIGAPAIQPQRSKTDVPLDEIAPLVENPLSSPLTQTKGVPDMVGDTLQSTTGSTGGLPNLAGS